MWEELAGAIATRASKTARKGENTRNRKIVGSEILCLTPPPPLPTPTSTLAVQQYDPSYPQRAQTDR